jgi:hypothetical protein
MMTSSNDFGTNMRELRNYDDDTLNVGKKWTINEDDRLAQEITEDKTYEEIALEHKRTVNSIELRIISHIIFPKIKADIEKGIEIDTSQLIKHLNKIKIKGEPKQTSYSKQKLTPPPKQKDVEPTNKQILEYLQKLDSKLNEINSKLDNLELI